MELSRQLDALRAARARLLVKIQLFQELSAEAQTMNQGLEASLERFATMEAAMKSLKSGAKPKR